MKKPYNTLLRPYQKQALEELEAKIEHDNMASMYARINEENDKIRKITLELLQFKPKSKVEFKKIAGWPDAPIKLPELDEES